MTETNEQTDTMRAARAEELEGRSPLVCGFCLRGSEEAGPLVAGRGTYICRDCARLALEASEEELEGVPEP